MLRHGLFPREQWATERVRSIVYGAASDTCVRAARVGVAHSAAALWKEAEYRPVAHPTVVALIADKDPGVLKALRAIFRVKALFPDDMTRELLDAISANPAILGQNDTEFLLGHLEGLVVGEPERVHRVCLALLDRFGEQFASPHSRAYLDGDILISIALRLLELGPSQQEHGTELFERMMELNLPGITGVLVDLDKRMPNTPAYGRNRPRRRRRRQADRADNG